MFIYGKTSANAIAVMSYLARGAKRRVGSAEIAGERGISVPLTAKLLTRLASAGLVTGKAGPGGGYMLARPASSVCLLDIVSLFEQTETPPVCPFGHDWCGVGAPCPIHDAVVGLIETNARFMKKTTLAIFAEKQKGNRAMPPARSIKE